MIEGSDKRATRTEEREKAEGESMLGAIDEIAKKKKLTSYRLIFKTFLSGASCFHKQTLIMHMRL